MPAPAAARASVSSNALLSPVVRRLVNEHGIEVAALNGTGPGGRITREDVLDHIDAHGLTRTPATAPAPAPSPVAAPAPAPLVAPVPAPAPAVSPPRVAVGARDEVIPLSKIRRLTGSHMVASKSTAPHAFSVVEVDFANVDVARNEVKDSFKSTEGFALTYLPFVSRAIVDAIAEFPHMNASLDGDTLVVHKFIDLGVAVDLDYQGLLVPVVRSAESKRLRAIAREIFDLASRARSRKLSPDEIAGGTFTVSNNGSAGSVLTMAIINQPQVAIVSTDAVVRRPIAVRLPDGTESIAIHPIGNLAMSWDHRAFDGAYAANFLAKVKHILETQDWSAEL
jgi:2-oxoglutarate dehydrogenase E2 component (dihydrolipoamide succinyltransferase)